MQRRKPSARTSIPPQDDQFSWMSVPNAVTLMRFYLLTPEMNALVGQTLRQISPTVWERDRGKAERIERADTPEALLDLAIQASGLAQGPWLRNVKELAPQVIPLLAERLKCARDVQDNGQRTQLVERLIEALYVCGPESAAALLDCFPALDDYGKSLAAAVMGMLGARESADTLWDFFNTIVEQPEENYFVGPLWGLVDLGDPRAADALAGILGDGFFFFAAFAMAHRAGDARLVLPLLYAMVRGDEKVLVSARFALISIASRTGRAAMLEALASTGGDSDLTDAQRETLADRLLTCDPRWSEDYFASFFESMDMSQVDPVELRSRAELLNQLEAPFSRRVPPRPGRNDPCWCGSGKKYKQCHLRQDQGRAQ